jgi:hypothetical protein
MGFSGCCEVDKVRFAATLSLTRHTKGHGNIFGTDDITVRLQGTCHGRIAMYVGTAEHIPS